MKKEINMKKKTGFVREKLNINSKRLFFLVIEFFDVKLISKLIGA
jgi:hypothetical protein